MFCIFCNASENFSEEHIIPESLGGSIVIRNVCRACNSVLGSEVDVELVKHRHIYDAYKQLETKDATLDFKFMDSFLDHPDGTRIKMSRNSAQRRVLVTKTGTNKFIVDENDSHFVLEYVRSKAQDKHLSELETKSHISNYLKWVEQSEQPIYEDELMELRVCKEKGEGLYNNVMQAKTPSRFVAKSCAEFSSLFGIESCVRNMEVIEKYARYGGERDSLRFFQETDTNVKAMPLHLIRFTENQYIITFFAQVSFAVEIIWDSDAQRLSFVNDIEMKKLFYAVEEKGGLRVTDKEFSG